MVAALSAQVAEQMTGVSSNWDGLNGACSETSGYWDWCCMADCGKEEWMGSCTVAEGQVAAWQIAVGLRDWIRS